MNYTNSIGGINNGSSTKQISNINTKINNGSKNAQQQKIGTETAKRKSIATNGLSNKTNVAEAFRTGTFYYNGMSFFDLISACLIIKKNVN